MIEPIAMGIGSFAIVPTGVHSGPVLPFKKRRQIIENLCDYFDTKNKPSIFVLDEADKDRQALERLFKDLISQGNKLSVEYDSAAKREKAKDDMYISILKAGKKLSINGVEISSVEDYWRWNTRCLTIRCSRPGMHGELISGDHIPRR